MSYFIIKNMSAFRQTGFTIVELLVTIVVIAILASVSLIAYTGIQDRARNTQVISLVNQWGKTLSIYASLADGYPTGNAEYVCLGTDFPADAPFATDQCMVTSGWGVSTDDALMDTIRNTSGVVIPNSRLNKVSFIDHDNNTQYYRGLLYLNRNGGIGITYVLKGNGNACTNGDGFFELEDYVACRRVLQGDPYQGL